MTGQCLPNCQRLVFIQRVCTNPAPSAGGRPCIGVDKDTTSEACREGLCLKGRKAKVFLYQIIIIIIIIIII